MAKDTVKRQKHSKRYERCKPADSKGHAFPAGIDLAGYFRRLSNSKAAMTASMAATKITALFSPMSSATIAGPGAKTGDAPAHAKEKAAND